MNLCKTKEEYISQIVKPAQRACKRYGYLPSVLIAQACLENGYGVPAFFDNPGVADLVKYNNMVGIKAGLLSESWADKTVWTGEVLNKDTPETYGNRNVTVNDNFRIYDNPEQSFADYLLFMKYGAYTKGGTPKYGEAVLAIKDPKELIRRVHSLGYATGKTYSDNVIKIIKDNKLTKYDDLSGVEPTKYTPGYRENKKKSNVIKLADRKINDITKRNKSQIPRSRGSNSIEFIVVHYLGVPNADNPDLYGGGYGGHYNIQRDGQIFKAANPRKDVVWHCGGGLQGSGGHTFFGVCTNYNSIGIENGVCYTKNVKEGDGDSNYWYFTEETQESLVYLVSKLMDEYKIPLNHVIRHYDVTGKICPNPYVKNNKLKTSWTWDEFKNNLVQYRKNGTITIPDRANASEILPAPITPSYLKQGDAGSDVKTMQKMLIACGYSCGSSGADGQFGSNTLKAVKAFQKAQKLTVDGIYGAKTKAALEKVYKAKKATPKKKTTTTTTTSNAADVMIKAVAAVGKRAHDEGWHYDDSHATTPCSDKKISCDRIIARALWDLGYHDQPKGGITCNDIPTYLYNWGFIGTKKQSEIKPGAVVAVGHGDEIEHVFVVEKYNHKTGKCDKYDAGSNARIAKSCHFKNVDLLEWADREFIAAWNVPENLKGAKVTTKETTKETTKKESKTTKNETKKTTWKAKTTATATVNDLNVRDKAGMEGKVLRTLNKGNRFEVDGKTSGSWVHVNVLGVIGWVHKKYIKYD